MASERTAGGVSYERRRLDAAERRYWGEAWSSVPAAVAAERGIEVRRFGPVQASIAAALADAPMLNLVLGATEPNAVAGGHLEAALAWTRERGVSPYVQVTPDLPETEPAEAFLAASGHAPGYPWMRFVRDPHPPRFKPPAGVEVKEIGAEASEPFGTIVANGFGLPLWGAALFAGLPGREAWRCYAARVEGEVGGCAAMLTDGEVALFGPSATLEAARRRGCQLALLRRRIIDAAEAGCTVLFVWTGARAEDRPAGSYRNILRAGFEEAYLGANWRAETGSSG
ncbi:MAG: hypothetical protein U0R71_17790 [Solirubrobacterales bacterium]